VPGAKYYVRPGRKHNHKKDKGKNVKFIYIAETSITKVHHKILHKQSVLKYAITNDFVEIF